MLRRWFVPIRASVHRNRHASTTTQSYLRTLRDRYPAVDPASLIASFVILHELTAIVPLATLFGTFHYLGLGTGIVAWTVQESQLEPGAAAAAPHDPNPSTRIRTKLREWIEQGEDKAEALGRRYGWFGWTKETSEERTLRKQLAASSSSSSDSTTTKMTQVRDLRVTGDVANLVAAYLAVKALLPLRILVSLRLSPVLANSVVSRFQGLQRRGAALVSKHSK
ncbi:uncharacterized protein JCM15063_001028 [Sporobolomyces koalae]|uniref:uncharacterized protein n=1 Tax=Sporobolomyces koalae TaxID=500713 RepID=UPI00316B44D1